MPAVLDLVAVLCLAFLLGFVAVRHSRAALRLKAAKLPGPKGLPILGNALDMPTSHHWRTFGKWKRDFGELQNLVRSTHLDLSAISMQGMSRESRFSETISSS